MPFGFLPERAFSFAGIPTEYAIFVNRLKRLVHGEIPTQRAAITIVPTHLFSIVRRSRVRAEKALQGCATKMWEFVALFFCGAIPYVLIR